MELRERLNEILRLNLSPKFTAVSYAIQVDGDLWAADALGTDGTAEKHPATTEHTFNVCSISKMFCTTAVMKLVEQGKLDLDTPVVNYLPKLWMPDERYKKITLRHCLSHSSGLPGTQWKHFSATHVGTPENTEYYDEVYAYLAKSHLKAEPGTYSVYCNDGFTLAEMVVAEVSGIPFGQFCREFITEPIGAHSTRTSITANPDYPLIREQKKVPEYFYLQGCGGFTTNMIDLCKFGQLFLEENEIISEASKAEMRKRQGVTFLPEDTASICFGLGWDQVAVQEPEFDLGDHVQMKGGNSFQFTSKLYIIPKYHAVLAISETHDCQIDVGMTILHMFATAMLEKKGISVYRKYEPIPAELMEKFVGTYVQPSQILNTHFFGTNLTLTSDQTDGSTSTAAYKDLKYDGERFVGADGETYFFTEHAGETYFFATNHGRTIPTAMRAKAHPELSAAWKARVGKQYVAINLSEQDMVSHEMMNGFTGRELPGISGIFVASFSAMADSDVYGGFESCCIPMDDNVGRGFLQTPSNGSRDLTDPFFSVEDGVEYCEVASYRYRDAATIPTYAGETFASELYGGADNSVYRFEEKLSELPEVPERHRLLVLDEKLMLVYDSQVGGEYKPVEKGFISFV